VKVPVIAVGRFRTPQVAEEVLIQGKADMVAIGRQLIADPHWLEKVATGRTEDITPCISCNVCFESGLAGLGLKCSVNAMSGRESELNVEPALRPKRVMVVGGGPAGMEAARVAAQRGHEVVLYERQNQLGGQLAVAAMPPYKHELALLNRYLIHQLEKSNVQVKVGVEVTPELVEKEKPDTVVLAAGAMPLIPEIPGINKCQKATAVDVLSGTVDVGEKVVVIGGELVGCETADFLSQKGKRVTVVRRGPEMASKMYPSNRYALLTRLKGKNVVLITGVKEYEAITQEGLVIIDSEGNRQTLDCDTIVFAAGAMSNDQMAKALEGKVGEISLAGDCVQPRRIVDAIHEGARLGREI
jgi:NADPH-dependent 2,4-dienoyl-CoA reductase/sulfur reductase-like enzyme